MGEACCRAQRLLDESVPAAMPDPSSPNLQPTPNPNHQISDSSHRRIVRWPPLPFQPDPLLGVLGMREAEAAARCGRTPTGARLHGQGSGTPQSILIE